MRLQHDSEFLLLCQGPTATLGIYVDAGSVYEKPMQTGAARDQHQSLLADLIAVIDLVDALQALHTCWSIWLSRPQ